MGLTLYLIRDGETIASINWLRNPFGLTQWASVNAPLAAGHWSLHEAIRYAGDQPDDFSREEFKVTVDRYWATLKDIEVGYFAFDLPRYIHTIQPLIDRLPTHRTSSGGLWIDGAKLNGFGELNVPQSLFAGPEWQLNTRWLKGQHTEKHYQEWFSRLVEIAEAVQDPSVKVEVSW